MGIARQRKRGNQNEFSDIFSFGCFPLSFRGEESEVTSVMISIRPKWCDLIARGEKTIEVRKTMPKIKTPFKCYIYCAKGKPPLIDVFHLGEGFGGYINDSFKPIFVKGSREPYCGKVIGEFVCDNIEKIDLEHCGYLINSCKDIDYITKNSCLCCLELMRYATSRKQDRSYDDLFAWHISDLKIYDKPKELTEFYAEDADAIKKCKYREIVGQPEDVAKHNGWLKGSYVCTKEFSIEDFDWCKRCFKKGIKRPPQSWCYVEE